MSFWSGEKLLERIKKEQLIYPFCESFVDCAACTLHLGASAYTTGDSEQRREALWQNRTPGVWSLKEKETVTIQPGQFGFLSQASMLKNFVTDTGDSGDCKASIPKSEPNSAPPSSLSALQVLTSIGPGVLLVMYTPFSVVHFSAPLHNTCFALPFFSPPPPSSSSLSRLLPSSSSSPPLLLRPALAGASSPPLCRQHENAAH